ncbi:uncharacterized protein LOC122853310 [Aphidius gifuensis]|uniref:uncharacterized protein LOC122853310 n=1 Tax=Aphidius gifuensis TaxID=684658 RepID=UPI001CDBF81F|nr:uncharacterized protein LOC122853310 [Aphidius gifuensis]
MKLKSKLEVEEISVKKNKGVNQDSSRSFNNKSKKIYPQHYDHSYVKNIIIDCVNDDCLAEIFTYVPTCERPKLAVVCKKWKRALDDSWFNAKKLELIYWRWDEYPNCLEKYPTIDEKLSFLKSLLNNCGRYLTKLDLTAYDHCNIVPVVNDYCPNLVRLRLRFTSIDDVLLFNAFTRLSKLKSLTIIFQNMKSKLIPLTLLNSLRNVADTLTELNMLHFIDHYDDRCDYPKEFDCVIRELKSLKRFEDAGIHTFLDISTYISDNKISHYTHNFYTPYSTSLSTITELKLRIWPIQDNSLYNIANTIKNLKLLWVRSDRITDDGVVAISKMNNLQYLGFLGSNHVTDYSIKLLKNMKRLILPRSNKITDYSVTKVLENSPNMEKLCVMGTSVTAKFFKKAAEISNNRKTHLYFYISFIPDIKQSESPYIKIFVAKFKAKCSTPKNFIKK